MSKSRAPAKLTAFLPTDHSRMNDLLQHLGSVGAGHIKFVTEMHGKRQAYRWPMITQPQREYIARLHRALCAQGLARELEAVA